MPPDRPPKPELPPTLASAVRQALRQAGKDRREIDLFLAEAMATDDPQSLQETCNRWVNLKPLASN